MKQRYLLVTASTTFFYRSRCRHCKSGPKYFFPDLQENAPTSSEKMMDELDFLVNKRRNKFLAIDPRFFSMKNNNSFSANYTKVSLIPQSRNNYDAFVFMCSCGSTTWFYSMNKTVTSFMRKSVMLYPHGFDYDWIF